jgi:Uma2 family endonuclease
VIATKSPPPPDLPKLIDRLGGIDPRRIRLRPTPGSATEDDLLSPWGRGCELVEGTLVERNMGFEEALVAWRLSRLLDDFVSPRKLGVAATGGDLYMRLLPGIVRVPDVVFISTERFLRLRTGSPIADFCPDLAVEVLSVSNTFAEIRRKRREYFAGGTQIVWVIDRAQRTVEAYTDPDTFTPLGESDTLTGNHVIPGFALPLAELFVDPADRLRP